MCTASYLFNLCWITGEEIQLYSHSSRKRCKRTKCRNILNIYIYTDTFHGIPRSAAREFRVQWPRSSCLRWRHGAKSIKKRERVVTHSVTKHFRPVAETCHIRRLPATAFTHQHTQHILGPERTEGQRRSEVRGQGKRETRERSQSLTVTWRVSCARAKLYYWTC